MASMCKNCENLAQNIYWTRFSDIKFFIILNGNFKKQIAIPKKFTENLPEKLARATSIKGPSGRIWNVGLKLKGRSDTFFFKYGWKEFVNDHSLQENDQLMFTYKGQSRFDVLIFDHQSMCLKESTFSAGKGGRGRAELGGGLHDETPPKAKKLKKGQAISTVVSHPCDEGSSRGASKRVKRASNRRPVSKEEKEMALRLARAAACEQSLISVMKSTQVYERFYLAIPAQWTREHLYDKSQEISLRVGEKIWRVKFRHRLYGGLLTAGWKKFATENFLEESDVCLFQVADGSDGAIVLNVRIFHVVDDAVPALEAAPASSNPMPDTVHSSSPETMSSSKGKKPKVAKSND